MTEREAVENLAHAIGYGRVMQICMELWRADLARIGCEGAELTLGPCAAMMVPCRHPVTDANGHCKVCCGVGRVTKWVAENVK